MASDPFNCLICSSTISTQHNKLNKQDTLFLLQILLDIPKNSRLISEINSSIDLIQLCDKCVFIVNQCKQMYTEVLQKIDKFWESHNQLLEIINDNPEYPQCFDDSYNKWANQCRKFVQHHDFTGFEYPFIVHDLDNLINSNIPTYTEDDPLGNLESVPIVKEPVDLELELTDEDNCIEYDPNGNTFSAEDDTSRDSDYQPQSHKSKVQNINAQETEKVNKTSQNTSHSSGNTELTTIYSEYDFRQDPITGKYICSDPSCSKSSISKKYITSHYKQDHLKITEKKSFNCEWPGCGKIIGDKQTWTVHMDKHKGTPKTECKECGARFYWRKELIRHKRNVHGDFSGLKNKRGYFCEVGSCFGKRFKSREEWEQHIITEKHKKFLKEICGRCGQRFNWKLELVEHKKQFGH